jgi:hypothetical protein
VVVGVVRGAQPGDGQSQHEPRDHQVAQHVDLVVQQWPVALVSAQHPLDQVGVAGDLLRSGVAQHRGEGHGEVGDRGGVVQVSEVYQTGDLVAVGEHVGQRDVGVLDGSRKPDQRVQRRGDLSGERGEACVLAAFGQLGSTTYVPVDEASRPRVVEALQCHTGSRGQCADLGGEVGRDRAALERAARHPGDHPGHAAAAEPVLDDVQECPLEGGHDARHRQAGVDLAQVREDAQLEPHVVGVFGRVRDLEHVTGADEHGEVALAGSAAELAGVESPGGPQQVVQLLGGELRRRVEQGVGAHASLGWAPRPR